MSVSEQLELDIKKIGAEKAVEMKVVNPAEEAFVLCKENGSGIRPFCEIPPELGRRDETQQHELRHVPQDRIQIMWEMDVGRGAKDHGLAPRSEPEQLLGSLKVSGHFSHGEQMESRNQ